MELEGRCLNLLLEVELLSDGQEVLSGLEATNRDMQKDMSKKYQEKVFEELKEFEEQRVEEACADQVAFSMTINNGSSKET